jgi:dUTP pyrophosphatase
MFSNKIKDLEEALKNASSDIKDKFKLKLKVVNKSNNPIPQYETNGASGFDLRANESLVLKAGEQSMVSTGLFFEIPDNFEIQVRPRSGLAAKYGVTVLNTPGTIDADYTGECKIILINTSKFDFTIENGDRIAQGIFAPVLSKSIVSIIEVNELTKKTDRDGKGFGSTGK